MSEDCVNRRGFVGSATVIGTGLVITRAATAAEEKPQTLTVPLANPDFEDLRKPGGSAELTFEDGTEVLVARVDVDQWAVVSLECTHQKCDIEYDGKKKQFVCPCHNSVFDLEGKPLTGPATKPLKCYQAGTAVVVSTKAK
ncbi:MAG: Rieske (2Fe-2S) protein [Fimbriimonadaceae bacterium]|nr:Rieske (2Fe-2S) protein [Fimbriimonadaceae bacterium]